MAEEGDLSLKEFVETHPLPQTAKVTQGYYNDSDRDDADFSTNDVIKVRQASFTFSLNFSYIHLEVHIFLDSFSPPLQPDSPPLIQFFFQSVLDNCNWLYLPRVRGVSSARNASSLPAV